MVHFKESLIGKYSVRNPSHPFIEILRNSNEATDNLHELICQQIQCIYKQVDSVEQASLLLRPVFVHIFLESSTYKHLIASYLVGKYRQEQALLNGAKISEDSRLSEFIILYFSHLKVCCCSFFSETEKHFSVKNSLNFIIVPPVNFTSRVHFNFLEMYWSQFNPQKVINFEIFIFKNVNIFNHIRCKDIVLIILIL